MAEAFIKTFKINYIFKHYLTDAKITMGFCLMVLKLSASGGVIILIRI